MITILILTASILIQIVTVVLVLRLIQLTRRRDFWLLITVAIILFTFDGLFLIHILQSPDPALINEHLVEGLIILFASIFMLISIIYLKSEYFALQRLVQTATAQRDSATMLTSSLNLEEVLDRILENTERVAAHDSANIMLVENEGVYIFRHYGYNQRGFEAPAKQERYHSVAETPILKQMVDSQQPVIIDNTYENEQWIRDTGRDWIRAYAGAPIHRNGSVIGFLNINSTQTHAFNQDTAQNLQVFAEQAAIAITNAQLYSQTQVELAERQRAEAALQENNNFIKAIIEGSPDIIFAKDIDGRHLLMNAAGLHALGLAETAVVGKRNEDIFPPVIADVLTQQDQEVLAAQTPHTYERNTYSEESAETLLTIKSTFHDAQGNVRGIVGISRNVTQAKRAEAQLKQHVSHLTLMSKISTEISSVLEPDLLLVRSVELVHELFDYHHVALF